MRTLLSIFLLVSLLLGASTAVQAQRSVPIGSFGVDAAGSPQVRIASAASEYYVLELRNPRASAYHPVGIAIGTGDSLTLTESLTAYAPELYRVRAWPVNTPGDIDGDGRDDLAELADASNLAPFNFANPVDLEAGQLYLPDSAAFQRITIGSDGQFSYLAGSVFTKFYITNNVDRDSMGVYFVDVNNYQRHEDFANAVGLPVQPNGFDLPNDMRGSLVYHPDVVAANGVLGLYTYQFRSFDEYDFETIQLTHDILAANMPFLRGNLAYRPLAELAFDGYAREQARYDSSRIQVASEVELFGDLAFAGLNSGVGYGLLRRGGLDVTPSPFDIVVIDILPNSLQRTSGIISSTRQTPLSHVNLRAIQDQVPNAYIKDAHTDPRIEPLFDRFVRYEVTRDTFMLREASSAEVQKHFEEIRPDTVRRFEADLTAEDIVSLDDIGWADGVRYGAKAANVAEMRNFGFVDGTIPAGYAVPFAMYNDFMEQNGLYKRARDMLAEPAFQDSYEEQERRLALFRKEVREGQFSPEAFAKLTQLQQNFPSTTPIRCRSSTNGEDLPGFSGAGLYDSKTQNTDEGHIEKSIKQVYASLWNYRAFLERDFYRIDHFSALMGVLVHPSYKEELVNGVAVSIDPVYGRGQYYYLNAQLGENLVTNPEGAAIPEEIFLRKSRDSGVGFYVRRRSNLVEFGQRVLDTAYLGQLRPYLATIHQRFGEIYGALDDPGFGMEIEFKVDSAGQLAIKQARPWAGYSPPLRIDTPAVSVPLSGTLYPNPTAGEVFLSLDLPEEAQLSLKLYDATGRLVFEHHTAVLPKGQQVVELPRITGGPLLLYRYTAGQVSGQGALLFR